MLEECAAVAGGRRAWRHGIGRAAAGLLLALLTVLAIGCASRQADGSVPVAAPPRVVESPHVGERVTAVVHKLERFAHEEFLTDGTAFPSNVVGLEIAAPADIARILFVHVVGHPRIGGRPLLLGDVVTFVLPRGWDRRDLAFEELPELAFVR